MSALEKGQAQVSEAEAEAEEWRQKLAKAVQKGSTEADSLEKERRQLASRQRRVDLQRQELELFRRRLNNSSLSRGPPPLSLPCIGSPGHMKRAEDGCRPVTASA